MKLGVRAHDFGRMEPEELARSIADTGFEAAQLALTKAISGIYAFSDVTIPMLRRVRRAFDENRIEISVLGCYVEVGLPDKELRLREVEKFLLGLEQAKELGVTLAGTETTRFSTVPGAERLREEAYQNLKDSVLRMTERAEQLCVDIGIETVADHTLNSAELTRRLLDEVKSSRLRVIFDPVNILLSENDIMNQDKIFRGFLETAGMDIAAVHIKDIVFEGGVKKWRNIGQGAVRYEPVFRWLRANKPELPVLREHIKPENCSIDYEAMKSLAAIIPDK